MSTEARRAIVERVLAEVRRDYPGGSGALIWAVAAVRGLHRRPS
jgi:hypothetical protein